MVVGFLRSSESRAQQTQQQPAHMMQAPAQTIAMHHHHLQLQSSLASSSSASAPPPSLASIRSSSSGTGGNHAVKRPFQELPRLHVPSHALAQQAQPMWKTGSVIMPSSLGLVSGGSAPPPPPAAPRFQFFTNTVGGWFGRNSAPAKTLPSFHEILARTNQLQIVGGQEDPENTQQQQQQQQAAAADIDMLSAQTQQQEQMQQEQLHLQHMQQQQQMQQQMQQHEQQQMQMQMQQQQQTLAMQYPPNAAPPSYTAFAPQAISLQANEMLAQRPSLSVVSGTGGTGAGEAPSPVSLASPAASQTSGDASKRRERWTEDEHARFMEGLNRYGRKWKKIQTFVQTKTAVQVRTHAYGYFAKLLRNMPEDDGVWELAEEMSSLPGAVLKGPGNGKRRNEPKTDEQGMDVLRRFVFSKKKTDDKKAAQAPAGESGGSADSAIDASDADGQQQSSESQQQQSSGNQQQQEAPYANWSIVEDSAASSAMLELKRQRIM